MKRIIVVVLFLLPVNDLFAQNLNKQLDQLWSYSNKAQIDSAQFSSVLKLFRIMESKHELIVTRRR